MKKQTQRDLQAENRRNQLLDLALALFAERGFENVSIKDLATEAQVAQGLIYHYFRSKDELLVAMFQRHNPLPDFEAITEELSDLPASQGLLLFAQRLAQLLPEKRLVLRLLLRELLSPRSNMLTEVISRRQHALILFSEYLQRQITSGELRPHQPLIPLHMLISSMLILLLLDQPLEPYVAQFVETILNGIVLQQENES
jgi:TetR/AcrR family transcriptional regulator, cholesterol catabolism regulator